MNQITATIRCDHVDRTQTHCNRYTSVTLGINESVADAIHRTEWSIVDGEIRCPEDADG